MTGVYQCGSCGHFYDPREGDSDNDIPAGTPFEDSVPFALDLTNAATGIAGLPIEYVAPVVTVAGSPSGTLPDGTTAALPVCPHSNPHRGSFTSSGWTGHCRYLRRKASR